MKSLKNLKRCGGKYIRLLKTQTQRAGVWVAYLHPFLNGQYKAILLPRCPLCLCLHQFVLSNPFIRLQLHKVLGHGMDLLLLCSPQVDGHVAHHKGCGIELGTNGYQRGFHCLQCGEGPGLIK